MPMFWGTWKLTHFLKIQIQILKNPHLGFLGSFDMLFLVLQANCGKKNQLDAIFFLSWPKYNLMLLDYVMLSWLLR